MKKRYEKLITELADYWELTKPGVTIMVVMSTLGGFYLGTRGPLDYMLLLHAILGSWLVASGTNAQNQLVERDIDAKMRRTAKRPLPAGRLSPANVLSFSLSISIIGIVYLATFVNLLTGFLALLTMTSYVFIYTPSKRKTPFSTIIGAVPGALPAMGGWTAVQGTITSEAWLLFSILFFWQLPHFLAIAWLYREDYERGGFPVLPVIDVDGLKTGFYIIATTLGLITASILPTWYGLTGLIYLWGCIILGLVLLVPCIRIARHKSKRHAKQLLLASIIYLPVLFVLIFIDKAPL